MPATRRTLTILAAALPLLVWGQVTPAPNPLDPIAHWVGGEWVSTSAPTGGRKVTLLRTYEWSSTVA